MPPRLILHPPPLKAVRDIAQVALEADQQDARLSLEFGAPMAVRAAVGVALTLIKGHKVSITVKLSPYR